MKLFIMQCSPAVSSLIGPNIFISACSQVHPLYLSHYRD